MPSLQPCSVAILVEGLDVHVVDVDHFLLGDVLHLLVASVSPLVAASMRSRSSSAFRPPIGMLHHDQPRLDLAGFRLRQDQRLESLSGDHVGRDAELLEFDAVVETPR